MADQGEDFGAAASLLGSWSDEGELVERARTQPEAFGHLYDRYYSVVLNYLFRRTLDVALAEELTSNTFFNALRALGGYESRGKFLAWLYRIAGNEIRLNWRARRKQHAGEARWRAELGRVRFATDRAIATERKRSKSRHGSSPGSMRRLGACPSGIRRSWHCGTSSRCLARRSPGGRHEGWNRQVAHSSGSQALRRQYEGDPATFQRNLH